MNRRQMLMVTLPLVVAPTLLMAQAKNCLLYTSDAADERSSVDLGGRRIIKKKKTTQQHQSRELGDK